VKKYALLTYIWTVVASSIQLTFSLQILTSFTHHSFHIKTLEVYTGNFIL